MTTTRRNHLTSHDHSPFIAERRRNLFPIEHHDVDSELGHIEPLCSDTSDSDNETCMISNYDIMGIVENRKVPGNETPMSIKTYSDTMSPLKLSPCTNAFIRDSPRQFSPSQTLKTPHDTSTKPVLQKEQKVLLEESKSLKRKSSPNSSPVQNKSLKVDSKSSKVRTALFPPENDIYASLPTKSFYSKKQDNILEKPTVNKDRYVPKPIKLSTARHSYKHKKKFGQINNGVRHSIRKPKQRNMSKFVNTKATKKMLVNGAVLNEFLQDLAELKNRISGGNKLIYNPLTDESKNGPINEIKTVVVPPSPEKIEKDPNLSGYMNDIKELQTTKKLISTPVKQIKPFSEENKENVLIESPSRSFSPLLAPSSPEDNNKSRKFFKSSRSRNLCKPETVKSKCAKGVLDGCDKVKNIAVKFILPVEESQSTVNNVRLENSNDFEDEDIAESQTNIDSILSVLSSESPQKTLGSRDGEGNEVTGVKYPYDNAYQSSFDSCKSPFGVLSDHDEISNQNESHDQYSFDSYSLLTTSNMEKFGFIQESEINICTDQNQLSLPGTQNSSDVNLADHRDSFDQNALEPDLMSSQVVFNDFLSEDPVENGILIQKEPILFNSNDNTSQESHILNKITLEAYNSISASENSIQLHGNDVANMILSPISHMCDVTSGLAINSPKKGRRDLTRFLNISSRSSKILSFNNCNNSSDMEKQQKLFPIFLPGAARGGATPERGEKRERGEVKRTAKRFKALSQDQMLLDAGQKNFGYTICNECNLVYHMGDPGDEIQHMNYHNANHILRFAGWKNEHVVADFQKNGRIIRVLPTDSKIWLKKVNELMEFVKRDLGCYEMEYDITGSQVYLYIKNRTIAGCAVATVPREGGHRMLSCVDNVAMCSEASYPIKCGISHIWVAANHRKQGVATSLMDAVKKTFVYGGLLRNEDVALTSPTEAGSAFAEKYFGTPNYLIYYV